LSRIAEHVSADRELDSAFQPQRVEFQNDFAAEFVFDASLDETGTKSVMDGRGDGRAVALRPSEINRGAAVLFHQVPDNFHLSGTFAQGAVLHRIAGEFIEDEAESRGCAGRQHHVRAGDRDVAVVRGGVRADRIVDQRP